MKRLTMQPEGWPCTLADCRPGHFLWQDRLCFKDEYGAELGGQYAETGEIFWGGAPNAEARASLMVQPVYPVWEEYEE